MKYAFRFNAILSPRHTKKLVDEQLNIWQINYGKLRRLTTLIHNK